MKLGSILKTIIIGKVSKGVDLESFESMVARVTNDIENGAKVGVKDVAVLASFARKNIQLGMEPVETFLARVKSQVTSDLRVASEDTKRLAVELEKRLHLDELHQDVMRQLTATETELEAMKKAWEGEEQDARAYFQSLQVADEVVEDLHAILGEAGLAIKNTDVLSKVQASINRRIHKDQTPANTPAAKPVAATSPAVPASLGALIALAAAPVPGTPTAKS